MEVKNELELPSSEIDPPFEQPLTVFEINLSLEVFKTVIASLKRLPDKHSRQRVIQAAMIFLRDNRSEVGNDSKK